jgi:hypothetical protein
MQSNKRYASFVGWTSLRVAGRLTSKFNKGYFTTEPRDSSDGIETSYTAGVRFPADGKRFFSTHSDPGAHPASYQKRTRGLFRLGVKQPGSEADHSLHLVPISRMVELYLHSPIRLHGVVLN